MLLRSYSTTLNHVKTFTIRKCLRSPRTAPYTHSVGCAVYAITISHLWKASGRDAEVLLAVSLSLSLVSCSSLADGSSCQSILPSGKLQVLNANVFIECRLAVRTNIRYPPPLSSPTPTLVMNAPDTIWISSAWLLPLIQFSRRVEKINKNRKLMLHQQKAGACAICMPGHYKMRKSEYLSVVRIHCSIVHRSEMHPPAWMHINLWSIKREHFFRRALVVFDVPRTHSYNKHNNIHLVAMRSM